MSTIKLKRRATGGASGAPSTLATTEPAYSEVDDILYLGFGDNGSGIATSIKSVAGAGAFVSLSTDQTINGTKTFGTTPVVGTVALSDNTTKAASSAFVKGQNYLTENQSISLSGDASGTGTTAIAVTLSNVGTSGTYTKVTTDAKGRVSSGTTLAASDIPTLSASKISDFDTQVRLSRLDQMAAPTVDVSLNSRKITNLLDPTSGQDAATKNYVDGVAQGLDVKESVRVATTANITLSGTQTIDGVAVQVGDRVLVKNQSTQSENGIYVVSASTWSRTADADEYDQLVSAFVFVEVGSTNADDGYVCTSDSGGTLGSTAITWSQFSGAGQFQAGTGITLDGNTFNVNGTANRISVTSTAVDIAATYIGQSSISTLGTVSTGTWQATTVKSNYGGTGLTSYTAGDLMYYTSGTSLSKLGIGASGTMLSSNGTAPVWTDTIDGGTY